MVASGAQGLSALGVTPTALEAVLPTYLWTATARAASSPSRTRRTPRPRRRPHGAKDRPPSCRTARPIAPMTMRHQPKGAKPWRATKSSDGLDHDQAATTKRGDEADGDDGRRRRRSARSRLSQRSSAKAPTMVGMARKKENSAAARLSHAEQQAADDGRARARHAGDHRQALEQADAQRGRTAAGSWRRVTRPSRPPAGRAPAARRRRRSATSRSAPGSRTAPP